MEEKSPFHMNFLPYEQYQLNTTVSAEEIVRRLKDNVEPKKTFRSPFGSAAYMPYEGEIGEASFEINRILGYRNSFRPTIKGTIQKEFTGTTVFIKMRMTVFTYVFMCIWLGGVFCGGIMMEVSQLTKNEFNPASLIILFMFLVGYGGMMGGFKYETRKSKKFLAKLTEGQKA